MAWTDDRRRLPASMDPFRRMQDEMERMLGNFGMQPSPGSLIGGDGMAVPSLDISEDDKAVEVKVDVPGVAAKDIDVAVEDGVLTISGTREEEKTEGGKDRNYHRVERFRGRFVRRIALPVGIDEGAIEARHDKGVLTIRLPKTAEEKATGRRIEVKGAA
jgi:HSP20 family protein